MLVSPGLTLRGFLLLGWLCACVLGCLVVCLRAWLCGWVGPGPGAWPWWLGRPGWLGWLGGGGRGGDVWGRLGTSGGVWAAG